MPFFRCTGCGAVNRVTVGASATCSRCKRALDTTGQPQAVDAAALVTAILSSPAPVLVDFRSAGRDALEVEVLAKAQAGELLVLAVDTSAEPAAAAAYDIREPRTLVLFRGGAEVARRTGAGAGAELNRWMAGTA